MEQIFKDTSYQKSFEQKGYIIVEQLLDNSALNKLYELFEKYTLHFEGAFHTSHFSSDVTYKREAHNTISQVVFEKAAPLLNNHVPIFGNFMIKNPSPNEGMDLHADWAYVDEMQHTSLAIWTPLVDTNAQNGCLGVIEGSHKITNLIRGPHIRQSSRDRDHIWEKKLGKLLLMKAGDAIIYSHRLLHYSPPNKTEKVRPAINLSLVPATAMLLHYCTLEGTDEIQLYEVPNTEFYLNYMYSQAPQTNSLIGSLPKNSVKYIDATMEKFQQRIWLNKLSVALRGSSKNDL